MSSPPAQLVKTARICWKWQWNQLMNALAPCDEEGNYQRPKSEHQYAVIPPKKDFFERPLKELPTLVIGKSCPWAHRTWLTYKLKNLETNLNLLIARPSPQKGKWELSPTWLGCNYLDELYRLCGSPPSHRATVPTLIDPFGKGIHKPKLLGNESSQLIEILNKWPTSNQSKELSPKSLEEEIKSWNELLQPTVNDGVYRCGFARNQNSYNKASKELFSSLDQVDKSLTNKGPWLCGEELTLADVRLFPTLIRWENIYMPFFGCSERPLWTFPKIWEWRRRFFNLPNVQGTCDSNTWRKDYFGNLFPLRPSGVVPAGVELTNIVNTKVPK